MRDREKFDRKTIREWAAGTKTPTTTLSLEILGRIEHRYKLTRGYFREKLPASGRAATGHRLRGISPSERRRLAWHLPDDFDTRPRHERAEILHWIRTVIISGSTDYRRYQTEAIKLRYGLRFPSLDDQLKADLQIWAAPRMGSDALSAPAALVQEVAALIRFKMATLTSIGEKRVGIWGRETAAQKIEHLALMFGALSSSGQSSIAGLGVPLPSLSMALLVFPSTWDWYLRWRENRRGFYTAWEINMLSLIQSLTRRESGWLWQNEWLAERLVPVSGLIAPEDIDHARRDWKNACEAMHSHALTRSREIQRVARVHRDPFEPILAVLESDSPVGTYRRITTEIIRRMPDRKRYPLAAAEAVRSLLMLRFGLHLGVRQKNLRQLLVCPRGATPRSERQLETLRCGEIRWSDRGKGWEVVIPALAFKNANSPFFGKKPFRIVLPDLDDLYYYIDAYLDLHRATLLKNADDPETFFVKTVKINSRDPSYNKNAFYEAWRLAIQRYGIFNPYTEKGAIRGLLPHGPHNVRDVLATHILKQTGSFEQASYAIQDTPEMVMRHYGRFLPEDKIALAAEVLNQAWAA